jgi:predicted oxidoreductase
MELEKVKISPDGPSFSPIIYGTMTWGHWGHKLDREGMEKLIKSSLDWGITTFDHADIYGDYTNEADFGRVLKHDPSLRDRIELITKCGICRKCKQRPEYQIHHYNTSKEHILKSAENSLKNFGTDYLDLLMIHRPDALMDPDEIAEAFHQLKKEGKVLHFGVSNFTVSQFEMLHDRIPLVTNQIEANIMNMNSFYDGMADLCQKLGIRPMAWGPLGGGRIFTSLYEPQVREVHEVGHALMKEKNISELGVLLLAWLLKHPVGFLPIVGSARPERMKLAIEALGVSLTRMEWYELWRAIQGVEVP